MFHHSVFGVEIGFCSAIALGCISLWRLTFIAKLDPCLIFQGCSVPSKLCIVKIFLILGEITKLLDLRMGFRRSHLTCSSALFSHRFLREMGAGSIWMSWQWTACVPRGSVGAHAGWWMFSCAFLNGFLASGHKLCQKVWTLQIENYVKIY